MSVRRASSYLFLVFLVVALIGVLADSKLSSEDPPVQSSIIPGRNVNMVSGTTLPTGDPWLQRQNEPSIAVSTRNPLHLLAGANDYRTVDMAFSEGNLPGKAQGAMAGDAWVGVYKSFDGGESWVTGLIPGFPQDQSAISGTSPLKQFSTAADPIVRAGTNGLFYYSGMAFNRAQEKGGGSIFLTRFIDNDNVEDVRTGDPIKYLDTKIIDLGVAGQFIDMPRIATDIPRGSGTVTIDGQTIPRANVYCAYTVFLGNTDINVRSRILFRRSTDCGATWGSAVKVSESQHIIQGATFAIDPRNGTIYLAFRRFRHPSQTDSIVVARSTDFGQTFSQPAVIANINPFDQPATDKFGDDISDPAGPSFRTNSYPTMTVDSDGIAYVAWTERGRGPAGEARIVMSTSAGTGWTSPAAIADVNAPNYQGHQFMPSLAYAQGKLVLVWYDQRYDEYGLNFGVGNWIGDNMLIRHTTDVRSAQAEPGQFPVFQPSVQVSKYIWALSPGSDSEVEQQQYNPPNFEMFKGGTTPFHGDYIEVTAAPQFVLGPGGWTYNTGPSKSPVFHAVWTDNRDVRPPSDGNWANYTPPASAQGVFGSKLCGSVNLDGMGMRNQNIYTSTLVGGIAAVSPGNSKTLGDLGNYFESENGLIPRAFVVYVKNPSSAVKVFRLSIDPEPPGVDASFLEFEDLESLDVMIAPFSTIARTVFVRSAVANAAVTVAVIEIDDLGGAPVPDGLTASVALNPDPTSPSFSPSDEYHNPNIRNPNIRNWDELNPNIVNPNIRNPNIRNWDEMNPNIVNPNIRNPNIVNPNIRNPNIVNPNIRNPNIVNPNIVNPNIRNYTESEFDGAEVSDVEFAVKNDGNTTSTYTLKLYSKESLPDEVFAQLLLYRVHYTPSADYYQQTGQPCEMKEERHHELLLNVANPNIRNPNIVNPNIRNPNIRNGGLDNATFAVAPGEEVEAVLRVIDFNPGAQGQFRVMQTGGAFSVGAFVDSVGFAATAHAINTEEARTVEEEKLAPKTSATKLIISTSSLPYGVAGAWYEAVLTADGGNPGYTWTLNSGELPPGLGLGANGQISGIIDLQASGLYRFIVRVDDVAGEFDTQSFSIYIDADSTPDSLTIITPSLPNGVLYHWYGATLEATGGAWPLTWSLASGTLPPGLSFDPSGVISGTAELDPLQDYPMTYNLNVVVTDRLGGSSTKSLNIAVYMSTGQYKTISGIVYSTGGVRLDGVVMRGLPNTPVTGANNTPGYYEDKVPEFWSGTVTPFKQGQAFSPASRTYALVAADQLSQDYNVGTVQGRIGLTGPARFGAGFMSEAFTITSEDAQGYPVNVLQDTVIALSSDSVQTSNFYADPAGATRITRATIPSGQSSVSFYYRDSAAGTPSVTASWLSGGGDMGSDIDQPVIWPVVQQIAFTSNRSGNYDIYTMNADGTQVARLTRNSTTETQPRWSPGGGKVAFVSNRDGNLEIYVMNADGSWQTRLTSDPARDSNPAWSPDGTKIVFTSERDGNREIYVMNSADGSGLIRLTVNPGIDQYPCWSPDGQKIAFASERGGNAAEIFIMNAADGSGLTNLTNNPARDEFPAWSPDGGRIAFASNRGGGGRQIFLMNAVDGSGTTQITAEAPAECSEPAWSPDGNMVSYVATELSGNLEIYVMKADGTGKSNLTNSAVSIGDSAPNWGGQKIAYSNWRSTYQTYIMNADGSGQTRVSNSPTGDGGPSWSPDGLKIACTRDRHLWVMSMSGQADIQLTFTDVGMDYNSCWSPDGMKIAFSSNREGNYKIFTMDADGSGQTRLLDMLGDMPDWSPDGTKIAFSGNGNIYVVNIDGSGLINLTNGEPIEGNAAPRWSPDGTHLLFCSNRDGDTELFIMDPNGENQVQLTNNGWTDNSASWSPDGRKIAYANSLTNYPQIHVMNRDGSYDFALTSSLTYNYSTDWRRR